MRGDYVCMPLHKRTMEIHQVKIFSSSDAGDKQTYVSLFGRVIRSFFSNYPGIHHVGCEPSRTAMTCNEFLNDP